MNKLALTICIAMAAVLGCSISKSSESISNSVSSPFELGSDSSKSSSGDSADTAYRDDVSDHTRTVVAAGGSAADLALDMGPLARRHGITDWEGRGATYEAMGRGLALAGVTHGQLPTYQKQLAGDPRRAELLRRGYDSAAASSAGPTAR